MTIQTINIENRLLLLGLIFLLASCSGERVSMPSQQWNDIKIEVETRPPRAVRGMNEFVIIASRNRRPASEIIVSIQIMGTGKWQQAMQDGHIGVFRKSLLLKNPKEQSLLVQIRHQKKENKGETILEYPMRQQQAIKN